MADTAVAITAGTGTNIDTRTEATNGHHRQVVVLGDPATNAGVAPVDATNGLSVDVKASALPTGAATSAKQDTGNTSLASIDGKITAVNTGAVVISSSALPSGASTAAKQPALGTAGTASADVITVQGIASMTAIKVDGSGVTQPVSGTVAVTNAGITTIAGAVAGTEMQVDVLTMPTVAVSQSGTWDEVGINDSGNSITVDNAQLSVVGTGTEATAMRVTIATDSTGVLSVDDNGGILTVDGTVALGAGTAEIGKLAAGVANIGDVDVASIAAGDNNIGNVDIVSGTITTVSTVTAVTAITNALPAGTNTLGAVKSVPSDIDINGSNANHADKYYTNAGAVTDGIVWSPAAGKRWHVLTLYINVSAAATVTLEDDLAGGDVARWKGELAANSGVVLTYDKEHPFSSGEDAADLIITTTAGNVYVQAVGYEV